MSNIPIVETYRGVGIHDQQSIERIATIVKPAIDKVMSMTEIAEMIVYAATPANPPEARLLAAAMCEATYDLAAEERRERPNVNLEKVRASVAGLQSTRWRDDNFFCSMFDTPRPPGASHDAVRRDEPLAD